MNIAIPNTFVNNTTADALQVDANFSEVQNKFNTYAVQTDVAKTITVTHTFSALQTFTAGITETSGSVTVGTTSVAISSLTITSAASSGNLARLRLQRSGGVFGDVYWSATDDTLRLATSGVDRVTLAASGLTTITTDVTMTFGALTMGAAASRIIPGATSFSHRNNANNADNLLITDAGAVTVRNGLTVAVGGATITGNSTVTGNLVVSGTVTAVGGSNTYVRRTTDLTFTTGSDSTLTFAMGASDEWEAEYVLFHTNGSAATMTATLTGPAGVTPMLFGGFDGVNVNASAVVGGAQNASGNAIVGFTMNATMAMAIIRLYVKGGGTGGNVTLQLAASAGTGTLKAGSFIRYSRIA